MTVLQGFYQDKALLEDVMRETGEIEPDESVDFSFLENELVYDDNREVCKIPTTGQQLSLDDYLHGYCHVFATRLHNEYGYGIVNVFSSDNPDRLIHSYCMNDEGELIDVRGKTSAKEAFFSEFEDWLDPDGLYEHPITNTPWKMNQFGEEELYEMTGYILRDHEGCYR